MRTPEYERNNILEMEKCVPSDEHSTRFRDTLRYIISFVNTGREPPPYLACSYCLMVASVSSMVLLQRVLTDDTKKLRALSSVSPFLDRVRCVSAL